MPNIGLGRRAALVLAAGLVTGCAGRGLWPFGGGDGRRRRAGGGDPPAGAARAAAAGPVGTVAGLPVAADGTVLLPGMRMAVAEPGRQGVILRAEGIAPSQGFHSPELRPAARSADGIETVELRAAVPPGAYPVGPERTRLLSVGRFYSNREMEEIRGFRIVSAGGASPVLVP